MYAPSGVAASTTDRIAESGGDKGLSVFQGANSPEAVKAYAQSRIRRRNRVITSCLECRRRKLKCDKLAPCTNCTRFKRDCLYLAPAADAHSQQKLAEIKERMGALEKSLEAEVGGTAGKAHKGGTKVGLSTGGATMVHVQGPAEEDNADEDDEEEGLEPTPLAALDNVYEDDADDELMDLGVQMGRMRISERIGGWIRPKLVDELNDTLKDVTGGKSRHSVAPTTVDHRDLQAGQPQPIKIQASPKSYIGPGPDYIAPSSSFFFPGTNMNTSLIDYLPSKAAADLLVSQYFQAVHFIARAVHKPTFESQYALFWGQIATGVEPVPSQQAIVFAAMFSAAVSMSEDEISQQFGTNKNVLIDSLRSGTEMALSKANFLRTTKIDTMQALVMYLIPLIRAEVSRAHSALVGMAIRLAECMGLHRDGSFYNMTAVQVHVRRMVWHQLCFLDMRTCEATGPRPQIRPGDYDTQLPLNVDDVDFLAATPPTKDKDCWTDTTLFRIRAEVTALRRELWSDIVQVDKKKKSLTSTLVKVQKARSRMETQFSHVLDASIPVQKMCQHVINLGVNGCFLQVLHRYLFSTATRMPDRLRQILIQAGVMQMENGIAVETDPALAPWSWYKGALNQYHSALLLMVEVYAYPMRKDAARIWKCLDYIFEIPAHLSPKQKAELVITDLRDRMEIYHQMRRIRSTRSLEERVLAMNGSSKARETQGAGLSTFADLPQTGMDFANGFNAGAGGEAQLPADFSPPPPVLSESSGLESRQGGFVTGGTDIQMSAIEDIDWVCGTDSAYDSNLVVFVSMLTIVFSSSG